MILMPVRSAAGRAGGLASDQTVRHVSHGGIGTKQAVDHPVPPGAIAPPGGARDPLPGEPCLLQGPLLGDVARLDLCPEAVCGGMCEQVTGGARDLPHHGRPARRSRVAHRLRRRAHRGRPAVRAPQPTARRSGSRADRHRDRRGPARRGGRARPTSARLLGVLMPYISKAAEGMGDDEPPATAPLANTSAKSSKACDAVSCAPICRLDLPLSVPRSGVGKSGQRSRPGW
jgi:hypothetical protein